MVPAPDPAPRSALDGATADGPAPSVDDLLVALAAERPRTGWEMARAIGEAMPGLLDEREGCLYALLAALVREGRLEAGWIGANGAAPRRVYAVGAAGGLPDAAPVSPAAAPSARLRRAAESAARSVPDPFAREEARAEVLSHLASAAGAHAAAGLGPEAAERAALRDLGDPWRVRTDLGRAHRGKRALSFPRTAGERLRGILLHDVIPLAVVFGLLLLVRWQVLQPYNIPTKSMEPTLHGDAEDPDFILVDKTAFRRRDIERWEVAVFYPPESAERGDRNGARQPFVKRCVGLGGESLDLRGGDAWVDGALARRSLEAEDAMMVPLYDLGGDLRQAAARARFGRIGFQVFGMTWGSLEDEEAREWSLQGGSLEARPDAGGEARLEFRDRLTNSYVDARGERTSHYDDAGDLEVRFVATVRAPGAVVGAVLVEGEARHEFRAGPGGVEVRSAGRTWTSPLGAPVPGRPIAFAFRNVDDRLTVRVDGEVVIREELPARVSVPVALEPGGVELLAEGGPASFGRVEILRDIVYLRSKEGWPVRIPPGRLFMMGDNTASSNDSRAWGPVLEDDLIGRPFLVAWPPSRVRRVR